MSPLDWGVVAAGVAAIAWVNWYFFLAERGKPVDEELDHASVVRDVEG